MYTLIRNNLDRQTKGLQLLLDLMHEEYTLLLERKTDDVMVLEMSIHELLRQLAAEKSSVIRLLGGGKLLDYAAMLPEEDSKEIRSLWQLADDLEQSCSRQGVLNVDLSLALLDQSQSTMDFLHKKLVPEKQTTYGRRGAYTQSRPEAALISGRL